MQLWKALAVLGEIERGLGRAGAASRFEEALEVIEWLAARAGDDALAATLRASAAVQSLRAGTRA